MNRTFRKKVYASLALAGAMTLAVPFAAFADNINDNIADNVTSALQLTAGDPSSKRTAEVKIVGSSSNGDTISGCNIVSASEYVTLTFVTPNGVTATALDGATEIAGQMKFTECDVFQTVELAAAANAVAGNYTVTAIYTTNTTGAYNNNVGIPIKVIGGTTPSPTPTPSPSATPSPTPTPEPTDSTPPVIKPNVNGTLGNNGWYTSDVTVEWEVTDAESSVTSEDGCDSTTISNDTSGTMLTCYATSAGGTSSESVTIKRDATAPTVTPDSVNNTTWRNTPLSQTFAASDDTSGLANSTDESFTLTASAESVNATTPTVTTWTVYDAAGNSTQRSVSALIDLTKPVLNITGPAGGTINVCDGAPSRPSFSPSDALSGIASSSDSWEPSTSASGVGTYIYKALAYDVADNDSAETRSYTVNYGAAYQGIESPIRADGSSRFKLGSTIPVKFRLECNGTPISNAVARLNVRQSDTRPDAGVDAAISTSAATSGNFFRYSDGQYIFNLSTKSGYTNSNGGTVSFSAGTWTLSIVFDDGTHQQVVIQLVK